MIRGAARVAPGMGRGPRAFCVVVGRARATSAPAHVYYTPGSFGRSVGKTGLPSGAVFMNTPRCQRRCSCTHTKNNSNFHRPTSACGRRPLAPATWHPHLNAQHTPTPVEGAFDGRPPQHREVDFGLLTPIFPFVHEQTKPAAFLTVSEPRARHAQQRRTGGGSPGRPEGGGGLVSAVISG